MYHGVDLYPQLNIISLCSGGGGLDLGVELAVQNTRAAVYVEREAFAIAHLVAAMEQGFLGTAPVFSDVKSFNGRPWRGLVDGLIGGIPCQGHSLAGKKLGSLDERDLWSPARRIIVQSRPFFVLIENVSGMLSPGADEIAGAERVWRDLRKLGFAVEGGLFTAAEVGASHQRERIFILGVADDALWRWGDVPAAGECDGSQRTHRGRSGDVADASGGRYGRGGTQRDLHPTNGGQDRELLRQPGGSVEQLADAISDDDGREDIPRHLPRATEAAEGEARPEDGERSGGGFGDGGQDVAYAYSERLERVGANSGEVRWEDEGGSSRLRDGAALVHAERPERGQDASGGHQSDRDHARGYQAPSGLGEPSEAVGDAAGQRSHASAHPRADSRNEGAGAWDAQPQRRGSAMADTNIAELLGEPSAGELALLQQDHGHGIFPPGPGDRDAWREILERAPHLEPAVRGLADGLAATRIDWLRLLGNGVVPLQAAYAFRVLANRLAARGSAAATLLVRMIGDD